MEKNMPHNFISDREAMAVAACDIAGMERPLPTDMPEEKRIYLYALPGGMDEKFSADELSRRLGDSSVQHGVDWRRDSQTYGLRFVSASRPLPAEIRPFATDEARRNWSSWKDEERRMSTKVVEAAQVLNDGKSVNFANDEKILSSKVKSRRNQVGERD